MFRRRAQRLIRRMGKQEVPLMLQKANQMMVVGDYQNAAIAFKDLAQRAEERFPQRSPILYMEAGRAAILGGQTTAGVAHLRRGLTLLASQGRIERLQQVGQRTVNELNERNLKTEADEISGILRGNLPNIIPEEEPEISKKPVLPIHCPACGAAVRPNEVEWLDEVTAECEYCGSPVRGN